VCTFNSIFTNPQYQKEDFIQKGRKTMGAQIMLANIIRTNSPRFPPSYNDNYADEDETKALIVKKKNPGVHE
jgi:hypothetical protein